MSPEGIPVVPVKGVALNRTLYSNNGERGLRDLDLLVARTDFHRCVRVCKKAGWHIHRLSIELGELEIDVDGFPVELHAEFGRLDFTSMSTSEVIERAERVSDGDLDEWLIDDIDHLLLLAVNVVKDGFGNVNPHQAEDLRRLFARLRTAGRVDQIVDRARSGNFATGLHSVATWMIVTHDDQTFAELATRLPPVRVVQPRLARVIARANAHPYVGLLVACFTNDDPRARMRAIRCLVRRGARRMVRGSPENVD
jgi:hypothetical protein